MKGSRCSVKECKAARGFVMPACVYACLCRCLSCNSHEKTNHSPVLECISEFMIISPWIIPCCGNDSFISPPLYLSSHLCILTNNHETTMISECFFIYFICLGIFCLFLHLFRTIILIAHQCDLVHYITITSVCTLTSCG